MHNIGEVLRVQGDYAGALVNFTEALKIFEGNFGRNHPNVEAALKNLEEVYKNLRQFSEPEPLQQALTMTENVLGADHPNVYIVFNFLINLTQVARVRKLLYFHGNLLWLFVRTNQPGRRRPWKTN